MKILLSQKIAPINLTRLFYICLMLFISINIFNIFASSYCFIDIAEHIHASYFVSTGFIPYKDFFEHHNPLLWYILAPLTKIFYLKITIFYIARAIALLFNLLNLWLIYQITKKFLYNKQVAQLSLLLLLSIPYIWRDATVIRPDIFMHFCFLSALYLLFKYLENKKCYYLICSFCFLSLSFLFLQKILPLCATLLTISLYLTYSKKISLPALLIASIIALLPLLIFITYLIQNGAFADWFYYNFKFNIYMKEYYNGYVSGVAKTIINLSVIVFLLIIRNKPENINIGIMHGLYLISAFTLFLWHPHIQYYLPYFLFSAPLIANIEQKLFEQSKYIYLILFVFIFALYTLFPSIKSQKDYQDKLSLAQLIMDSTSKKKTTIDLDIEPIDIFAEPHNYYWFGYHNVVIIDILTHPTHMLDLNQLLKQTKPDYIHYEAIPSPPLNDMLIKKNSAPFIKRNQYIVKKAKNFPELLQKIIPIDSDFYKIDEKWIEKYYHGTNIKGLWQRNI